jgi:hypothetical protein
MATDPKAAFRTHSNYLSAFDAVMAQCYSPDRYTLLTPLGDVLQGLASAVRASPAFGRLTKRSDADTGAVSAILRNAWATELLLASAGQLARDELIGLANNWAVVQAYYASYHAAQALTVARGQPRPQTHTKTQKAYCDFWVARPVSLPPWSLAWAASGCANLPRGRSVTQVHPWTGCDDDTCWDLVALALRTTRQDALRERIRRERKRRQNENRKRWASHERERLAMGRRPRKEQRFPLPLLSRADKSKVDHGLRPATFLDYLYRLRVRSNYEDVTMFTEGPENEIEARLVHLNLRRLTSATLLVHELHIGELMGRDTLQSLVDEWLEGCPVEAPDLALHARRHLLLSS